MTSPLTSHGTCRIVRQAAVCSVVLAVGLFGAVGSAFGQSAPDVEPASTPDVEPAAKPNVEPAAKPDVEPAAKPDAERAVTPKLEPVAKPKPKLAPAAADDGPAIELPPDEQDLAAPTGGDSKAHGAGKGTIATERTDKFSNLGTKAASIVNNTLIGGYGEAPMTVPFDGDSFFEARRLVIFLFSQIHSRITFSTEIEFEFGGTPKKKDGQLSVGEVILEYAAVDFKLTDLVNLRVGVILVPFGKFNINHDSPTRDLTDRPLVIRTVIPSTWFEAGAGGFGVHRFDSWELNWEAYAINGLDSRIFDGLGNRGARGSLIQDNNNDKALIGRLGLGYFGSLGKRALQAEFGSSYYDGAYDREGHRARLIGGDATVRLGKLELLGEVVRQFNEPGFDDDFDTSSRRAIPEDLWGFYAQLNYHFFPAFLRRALPEDLKQSTFTASLRYDSVDTDMSVVNENDRNIIVAGINYRPIEAFVWKHEIQRRDSKTTPRSYFYQTSIAYLF